MKRGRKSAAANVVSLDLTKARPRITPLAPLTKIEAKIFSEAVRLNAHLRECDGALLTSYAQALAKTYRLAKKDDAQSIKSWNEAGRNALAYARALRLTTISVHRVTAGRAQANAAPRSFAERMIEMDNNESADE